MEMFSRNQICFYGGGSGFWLVTYKGIIMCEPGGVYILYIRRNTDKIREKDRQKKR